METIQRDKDGRIISFDVPAQVKWFDYDYDDGYNTDLENSGAWAYGIAFGSNIICACCGGIIPISEIYEFAPSELKDPVRPLEYWVDFTDVISD